MVSAKTSTTPFYSKLAMVLISLIALFYIAILGKDILAPLLFSLLFAILLLPVATFLEKRMKLPRSAAAILSVLILIGFNAGILYLVGSQISDLTSDWPLFKQQFMGALEGLQHWITLKLHMNIKQQMNYVSDAAAKILTGTGSAVIGGAVLSVSSVLLFLVFTMIYTFFLLYYRRLLIRFLVSVFKEENSVVVYEIVARVQHIIRRYILGLLLETVIVAGACCLAFWILGIKYGILLGLLTGLFNIIPYIGILMALLLSTLITFATTAASGKILLMIIIMVVIHLMDANVLMPLVVGSQVRINAMITVLGVIIGGSTWGIAGAFLAIPVIAIAKILFDRIESLKPWGLLFGDEKDEKQPGSLKAEIQQEEVQKEKTQKEEHKGGPVA
jgi:predicted PurR-regulated permease PerM